MTRSEEAVRLTTYLRGSRDAILKQWQEYVAADPELTTASAISHAQFTDSIPALLEALEHSLRLDDGLLLARAGLEQRRSAAEHGAERWQLGYALRETVREWMHLQSSVLRLIERYELAHPGIDVRVSQHARATVAGFFGESVCESAARYARLQQDEAASRMRDLEGALREVRSLERHRALLLREAAHDLRGSIGVITQTSAVLARSDAAEPPRRDFYRAMNRAIAATQSLLEDLLDLARLEAGQDRVELASFDVAALLRELSEALRPIATERSLFLKAEGPSVMIIESDAAKIRRIVQNLVLNALQATASGGVRLVWQAAEPARGGRWTLCIQDTGPGLEAARAVPLRRALKQVTEQQHDVQVRAALAGDPSAEHSLPPTLPTEPAPPSSGKSAREGIGLSIVKRLCELLDAGLELETGAGQGTTFRLSFPPHYPHAR